MRRSPAWTPSALVGDNVPLVFRTVLCRTDANTLSVGLVVRRWSQRSEGFWPGQLYLLRTRTQVHNKRFGRDPSHRSSPEARGRRPTLVLVLHVLGTPIRRIENLLHRTTSHAISSLQCDLRPVLPVLQLAQWARSSRARIGS